MMNQDTICAISTAPGVGGIAVIRISGNDAINISDKIFQSNKGSLKLKDKKAYTLSYGKILMRDNSILDDVIVSIFRGPHSFTGEDTIEITCHGSVYIQQQLLQLLVDNGCRLAMPGEFTQRAFVNGKMDLAEAEAVADLIASDSAATHKLAMSQMKGAFSKEL